MVWSIWPYTTRKIWSSSFKILPNTKLMLNFLAKDIRMYPKWRNFTKSGHTGILTTDETQNLIQVMFGNYQPY